MGLGLNSLFGWSWADPLAALVIAGVAVKEGLETWRGDNCCDIPVTLSTDALVNGPTNEAALDGDACGCAPDCDCCN